MTLHQSETQFEQAIVELAHLLGWKVAAFRPARRKGNDGDDRWETPCKYDAKGWPDLTLVRERVVFAELKSHRGKLSDEQAVWLDDLAAAGVESYLWRPDMWPEIEAVLRRQECHGG